MSSAPKPLSLNVRRQERTMIDLSKVVAGISKSGFVLEHRVSEMLRAEKWSVINNKYYIDDVQESAREIDLIAYKTSRRADFVVFTALVISCKKSDENAWAFLIRDRDEPYSFSRVEDRVFLDARHAA
jgi:hypothetical protein